MSRSHKIQSRDIPNQGKGFVCIEDIKIGEQILSVSDQQLIGYDLCQVFDEFKRLQLLSFNRKVIFAFFLAAVEVVEAALKIQICKVKQYIKQLPNQMHGLLCWKDQELQQIKDQELVVKIKQMKIRIAQDFMSISWTIKQQPKDQFTRWDYRIFANTQEIQKITLERVLFFYCVISSRSINDNNYEEVGSLAPILQLFNHSKDPQCDVKRYNKNIVRAVKEIKKGEQIFVCYGNYHEENDKVFLENYGFLPSLTKPLEMNENYRENLARSYNTIFQNKNQK